MVSPAPADFEIARGVAFEVEAEALDQSEGGHVLRLDVRFEAVQAELPERVVKHESKGLAHVSLSGEGRPDVIAQVGTLEPSSRDLTDLDRAQDHIVSVTPDEKANEVGAPTPSEVSGELRACPRGRDPGVVERAAPAIQPKDLPLIRATREGEVNTGSPPFGSRHSYPRHLNRSE